MDWRFRDGVPIYSQIVEQMRYCIARGEFGPGEKIPAVRELAVGAGVNPNTMQKALAELEREGLLYTERTSGRFVTEDKTMIERAKRGLAERHIKTFLEAMVQLGYQPEEIMSLLRQETSEEGSADGGSGM